MVSLLIQPAELHALRAAGARHMVFDCSFALQAPAQGRADYLAVHLPAAVHADLNRDLSAHHGVGDAPGSDAPASGGRHPLPSREGLRAWLSSVGFANDMQAVVYDRNGGNFCGRLWWMLKWTGHDAVAVLDGGLQAWQRHARDVLGDATGGVVAGDEAAHPPSQFLLGEPLRQLVSADAVAQHLGDGSHQLLDARAPARFRGEVEPLDPVAGHIPGARNRPFTDNFAPDGRFRPAADLRADFERVLQGADPQTVVHQCGSGVSALPNLIAMEIAGFAPTALFAGSWSEWVSDPVRPVARAE